jgi:hypothetical protein
VVESAVGITSNLLGDHIEGNVHIYLMPTPSLIVDSQQGYGYLHTQSATWRVCEVEVLIFYMFEVYSILSI